MFLGYLLDSDGRLAISIEVAALELSPGPAPTSFVTADFRIRLLTLSAMERQLAGYDFVGGLAVLVPSTHRHGSTVANIADRPEWLEPKRPTIVCERRATRKQLADFYCETR